MYKLFYERLFTKTWKELGEFSTIELARQQLDHIFLNLGGYRKIRFYISKCHPTSVGNTKMSFSEKVAK